MFRRIKQLMAVYLKKKKWRSLNPHNYTAFGQGGYTTVSVGNFSYGVINVPYYGRSLRIGHFCSIADGVTFLTSGEHSYKSFSTYPFNEKVLCKPEPYTSKGGIVVEDDVWIGYGATILSGVTIGQGAVIGAGSVVAKDVPPYAVFAGNKVIKYRFAPEIIEKLLLFDFGKLTREDIEKNENLLTAEPNDSFFSTDFYRIHKKT